MIEIKNARLLHLDTFLRLFKQYRAFHQLPAASKTSRQFLQQRIEQKDAVILLAFSEQKAVGFALLFPSISSLAMKPVWILNDLFVEVQHRRRGVARELILQAERQALVKGIFSIKLATAEENLKAQSVYQAMGYRLNESFKHYGKLISKKTEK